MDISLARWDDRDGDSSGHWLVREVAGLCLVRGELLAGIRLGVGGRGWQLLALQPLALQLAGERRAARLWGSKNNWTEAHRLLDAHPQLRATFATRQDALTALAQTLSIATTPGVLGEVLA